MKASRLTISVPPFGRSRRFVRSAAGFIATSTSGASPGVRMSWSAKWSWKPETPGSEPAGARISAGKSGSVEMSLPTSAVSLVKRPPVSCMPSPESPAKRMVTCSSCSTCLATRYTVARTTVMPQAFSGGEQLVRIDLVPPAEEVPLGLVLGRAVHREPQLRLGAVAAALELLEPALGLLGRRALCVALRHQAASFSSACRSSGALCIATPSPSAGRGHSSSGRSR